ncbi:unnamed protein product, partial [Phaeothamnion confervicola]
ISRARVPNFYDGSQTTVFSASNIGLFDASSMKRQAMAASHAAQFSKDAAFQCHANKNNHPSRKLLHMQKFYPATIKSLDSAMRQRAACAAAAVSKAASSSAATATPAAAAQQHSGPGGPPGPEGGGGRHGSQIDQALRAAAAREASIARSKMEYNRFRGRVAEVHSIITGVTATAAVMAGTAAATTAVTPASARPPPLFPAHATHQQLLGIMRVKPPDPEAPVPSVPRPRRWLGEHVGWEGNRGLATPPAGAAARDGAPLWPWPSSEF